MYICKGCFCKKETNGICPRCGYDEKNYIVKKEISKPGTILLNRYLLGNCIKETDEYINYKAYDRVLDEEIIIQQKKQGIPESWYLNKLRWFCYFKDNPQIAIQLLSAHREDPSEYVRKSVGNALRDISKKYPELISKELSLWNLSSKEIIQVYKLANKFLDLT